MRLKELYCSHLVGTRNTSDLARMDHNRALQEELDRNGPINLDDVCCIAFLAIDDSNLCGANGSLRMHCSKSVPPEEQPPLPAPHSLSNEPYNMDFFNIIPTAENNTTRYGQAYCNVCSQTQTQTQTMYPLYLYIREHEQQHVCAETMYYMWLVLNTTLCVQSNFK
jgi:hypothetical protein